MPVLVEALSVIVRNRTIEEKYAGGMDAYRADCPNGSFCSDEYLSCVLFTIPFDVGQFVQPLMKKGLESLYMISVARIYVYIGKISQTASAWWKVMLSSTTKHGMTRWACIGLKTSLVALAVLALRKRLEVPLRQPGLVGSGDS